MNWAEVGVYVILFGFVFLSGWAMGRSGRPTVVVNFPELRPIDRIKPTQAEVAAAMRKVDE